MPGSYIYSIGPLVSALDEGGGRFWRAPDNVVGMIDLAKNSDFVSDINSDRPMAFFASTDDLGAAYATINPGAPGDLREINATGLMHSTWESATGFNPSGAKLIDLVVDHLTTGADPLGDDAMKPLCPTNRGELEIWLPGHSKVFTAKFSPAHPHWNKYVSQVQAELMAMRTQARDGKMIDPTTKRANPDYHLKVADALMEKMRRMGVSDFEVIRPTAWPKRERPVKHSTTITESWPTNQTGITTNQDLTWAHVADGTGIRVVSNLANGTSNSDEGTSFYRAESDLSSSDHYCQHTQIGATATRNVQPTVRFASAASTMYAARSWSFATPYHRIRKIVAAAITELANDSTNSPASSVVVYLSANGSTLTQIVGGVTQVTTTDTSITGNTRCGFHWGQIGSSVNMDDWEAGDLAAAPSSKKHLLLLGAG